MGNKACLGGIEVPIIPSDSLNFFTVSVPSSFSPASTPASASRTRDHALCSVIGNLPAYFIWRTSVAEPNALTIIELYGSKDFPRNGLRIVYEEALLPFAFICKMETYTSPSSYMFYTLTVSGVAYLVRLRDTLNYSSCSVFPSNEITEFNTQIRPHVGEIAAVIATQGCLVIGRNDGYVSCFRLGVLDPSSPDQ